MKNKVFNTKIINTNNIINLFIFVFLLLYYKTTIDTSFEFYENLNEMAESWFTCFIFCIIPLLSAIYFNSFRCYFIGFIIIWIIFVNVNPYPLNLDNKYSVMELYPEKYRPKYQFLLSQLNNQTFLFPVIVKPIFCTGDGMNVSTIYNKEELKEFISKNDTSKYMIQEYLDYPVEVGILWEGKVIEIVEKINENDDNGRRHLDMNHIKYHKVTEKLNKKITELSHLIPNMNVTRYDIRAKSIDHLFNNDFKILESNGTMGMKYLNDSSIFIDNLYVIRWFVKRLQIGLYNIITLNGYSPSSLLYVMYHTYTGSIKCNYWENLYSLFS